MAPLYKLFAEGLPMVTFTQADLEEAYRVESTGQVPKTGIYGSLNGYIVGKKYLNLQVTSWRENIRDCSVKLWEIYEHIPFIPYRWWLDSVLKDLNGSTERPEWLKKSYDKDYIIYSMLRREYDRQYED